MSDWDFNGEGVMLLIDKPLEWTSFDVVNKVKSLFHVKKVGHAGTLDPRATGLLIVCTGKKTKSIDQFVAQEKEYTGTMELGVRTASFDSETPVIERRDCSMVTAQQIETVFAEFVGIQQQLPPMYSAVKLSGKALYKYARKGKTVERPTRSIEIRVLQLMKFEAPLVEFRVVCTKGTYVRSLVNDIGERLGCGAVLRALRRERIGQFSVAEAKSIEELKGLQQSLQTKRISYDRRTTSIGNRV